MLDFKKVEDLVEGVTTLIPVVGSIISGVVFIVESLEGVKQEDVEALKAKIRKAQESIAKWG